MAYLPKQNQSVSGTVGASVIGLPYFGVAGSVATIPISNQSVSGTVNVGGSVVAFQSDPTKLLIHASVSGNVNVAGSVATYPIGNQSVSGTVGASIIGLPYFGVAGSVAAIQNTDPWKVNVPTPSYIAYQLAGSTLAVSGSFSGGNSSVMLMPSQYPIGSVAALQGTNPWVVNVPTPSYLSYQLAGSILSASVFGAVTIVNPNSSVQLVPGSQPIGSVATLQGTNPWIVNVPTPSYIAYQLAGSILATNATLTQAPTSVMLIGSTNTSISALIQNQLQGVSSVMLFGSTNSSVLTVQRFGYGSVMLMTSTDASIRSLVYNQLAGVGSVMLFGSTNTSIATLVTNQLAGVTSVYGIGGTINISGSVLIQSASNSILTAGTYLEDVAHTYGDRGVFTLALRNDNLASVTTTSGDYSPFTVGPSGETIVANAPITKWISTTTSVMAGPSVLVFAAPGASIFNYVSGVQVTNPGTVAAHVTFTEGLGAVASSMLFFAIAPAGGGSNMVFPNPIKTTLANKNISASVSAHSSVYVMMEGFTVNQLT